MCLADPGTGWSSVCAEVIVGVTIMGMLIAVLEAASVPGVDMVVAQVVDMFMDACRMFMD